MRWILLCLLLLALLSILPATALGETRVMVLSDPHYLAPDLYQGSDLFLRALRAGDGKIPQYGEELMAALVEEVRHQQPDALVITGDLSFNGEKESHEQLAQWLRKIEAEGVQVWVMPGNHDINCPSPRVYEGNGWRYVDGVTPEDFARIYADFLLPPEGGERANASYHVRVSDSMWLALADVAHYRGGAQVFGLYTPDHAAWLTQVLTDAEAAGAQVITCTHHSLIPHTQFAQESYVMFNSDTMRGLIAAHGVRLNLSGHLHIQHIAAQDGVTDAATGAFCMTPHRYALVTLLDDGTLTYSAHALCDAHLPDGFQEMSRAWFAGITSEKNRAALSDLAIPPDDLETMLDFSTRFNLAYFSGTYRPNDPAWRQDPGYALWEQYGGGAFGAYLRMVMQEPQGDHLLAVITP